MIRRGSGKRDQIFVAHSYRHNRKGPYRRIYRSLEKKYPVAFVFADERITNLHVLQKIESYIRGSEFSIFDITGWNPNVTLELGIAYAGESDWYIAINPYRTPVKEVPSDIRGIDRIQYRNYAELEGQLAIVLEDRYPRKESTSLKSSKETMKRRALKHLSHHPGLLMSELASLLGVEVTAAQTAINELVAVNRVRFRGDRRGRRYFLR
jgi:predicted nucleotide-binding protein